MFSFEHHSEPILHRKKFLLRFAGTTFAGILMVLMSLVLGIAGYHYLESLSWLDAFANAAMILSGMGPLAQPQTILGKLFAGCYALYSGLAVFIVVGVTFAPVIHRFLHKLHAEKSYQQGDD
jgi:hypothetical protein